jgi:3-oxoacyl-[acyl-carrier-protein] synthase I
MRFIVSNSIYLNSLGIINPLGAGKKQVAKNLFSGSQAGMINRDDLVINRSLLVGSVLEELPDIPAELKDLDCRNNRLMLAALLEIEDDINQAIDRFGAHRIAVVLGTSTSGISDGEVGVAFKVKTGHFPESYNYTRQETGSISEFVSTYFKLPGQALTISTACTSSANALASARRYINAGFCDAAIVGGADTLCGLTLNGFQSLEALSSGLCSPFSRNRDGINIGEGAAAFLMSKEKGPVSVLGIGGSSDAFHISAPDPTGRGAKLSIMRALEDSGCQPDEVGYVNLHGTGTPLNDAMESIIVSDIFKGDVLCSSTKPMTGHLLGACGANEVAFLWLTLQNEYSQGGLPPHLWDGVVDEALPALKFATMDSQKDIQSPLMMSNFFAFGGNNISVLLGGNN